MERFDWRKHRDQMESAEGIHVLCKTLDLAKDFLFGIQKMGILWADGDPLDIHMWDTHRDQTCYEVFRRSAGDVILKFGNAIEIMDAGHPILEYSLDVSVMTEEDRMDVIIRELASR